MPKASLADGHHVSRSILDRKIKLSSFLKWELYIVLFVNFLSGLGYLPSAANYFFDVFNIIVLLISLKRIGPSLVEAKARLMGAAILAYLAFCLLSSVINLVQPQLVIWELMCVFRPFVYMLLIIVFLSPNDVFNVFDSLYKAQIVNIAFVAVEYFYFGLNQDCCGGIFGVTKGCNAGLNIYLCFVVAYATNRYLCRSGRFYGFIFTIVSALVIAAVAELRFYFFEFIFIIVISLLINRPNRRLVLVGIISIVGIYVGLSIFNELFPDKYEVFTDLSIAIATADNSNIQTGYGVSRINAFSQLSDWYFRNDLFLNLFGMGFGSATQSSIEFFTSQFYSIYGIANHYHYLQSAYIFLQTGYIGVVAYSVLSIIPAYTAIKETAILERVAPWMRAFTVTICLLFIANCMYNNTAHTYYAFMWAIQIGAIFVVLKDKKQFCEMNVDRQHS